MPTQTEKTIAFLNKLAAETGTPWYNESILPGGKPSSFQQPAPPVSREQALNAYGDQAGKLKAEGDTLWNSGKQDSVTSGRLQELQDESKIPTEAHDKLTQSAPGSPEEAALAGKSGVKNEAPGFLSNVGAGLARGHAGTVAATGAVALLAGVLAYNLLKKKKKGAQRMQMPGMAKAAAVSASKPVVAGIAGAVGSAAGIGGTKLLGGEAAPAPAPAPAQTLGQKVGLPANITTGNDMGDAAIGGAAATLGVMGIYKLYKALRGSGE